MERNQLLYQGRTIKRRERERESKRSTPVGWQKQINEYFFICFSFFFCSIHRSTNINTNKKIFYWFIFNCYLHFCSFTKKLSYVNDPYSSHWSIIFSTLNFWQLLSELNWTSKDGSPLWIMSYWSAKWFVGLILINNHGWNFLFFLYF